MAEKQKPSESSEPTFGQPGGHARLLQLSSTLRFPFGHFEAVTVEKRRPDQSASFLIADSIKFGPLGMHIVPADRKAPRPEEIFVPYASVMYALPPKKDAEE